MSCEKAGSLLHGYLDGELDAARAVGDGPLAGAPRYAAGHR